MPTEIMLIVGPPCSGKSTYVAQHMLPGDLIFDFDVVAQAVTGLGARNGGWPDGVRAVVCAMRDAFIARAQRVNHVNRAWITSCTEKGFAMLGRTTIHMKTPEHECLQRAAARSPEQLQMVSEWFERNP